jgi:hypothetical protein
VQVVQEHPGDPAEREPSIPGLGELQEVHVEPAKVTRRAQPRRRSLRNAWTRMVRA